MIMIEKQSWRLIIINLYNFDSLRKIFFDAFHPFKLIFLLEEWKIIWVMKRLEACSLLSMGCEPWKRISV